MRRAQAMRRASSISRRPHRGPRRLEKPEQTRISTDGSASSRPGGGEPWRDSRSRRRDGAARARAGQPRDAFFILLGRLSYSRRAGPSSDTLRDYPFFGGSGWRSSRGTPAKANRRMGSTCRSGSVRRPFVAGNWKMNLMRESSIALAQAVAQQTSSDTTVDVAVCPPYLYLDPVIQAIGGSAVGVGAQNVYHETSGAFTGEVSPSMVEDLGQVCDPGTQRAEKPPGREQAPT